MSQLSELPNVGKVLEENLTAVGITTPEQLKALGSKEAFLCIRLQKDPGACLHMLYGIEGAIKGIKDKYLSEETKKDLRAYYKAIQEEYQIG